MVSNQILQKSIDGIKEIAKAELAVYASDGEVLAATFGDASKYSDDAGIQFSDEEPVRKLKNGIMHKVMLEDNESVAVFVMATAEKAQLISAIVAQQISELSVAYQKRYDRDNFIKNLLLDNLLLVDIYNHTKKLHVEVSRPRVVMVVECGDMTEGDEVDRVKNLFGNRPQDFVTAVDENSIIVVRELSEKDATDEIEKAAITILEAFSDRDEDRMRVAYGTVVEEIKEVSRSYKEAAMALDVGKIFFRDKRVIAYSALGIGRLIYQLPIPLCRMFIGEIFEKRTPEEFDEETITTINKFFENSLNVSETSRQLYIHRNTLVYRLDKIQKSTGLDLRVFEDAITFKIALMVVEYMKFMEEEKF